MHIRTTSNIRFVLLLATTKQLLTMIQIKWQDRAHYHSTWESYEPMTLYKGIRKVDNYFKATVLVDMYYTARKKTEPEEYEQHMVARVAERESQLDYHIVDKVIDTRQGEDETEYLVKCKLHLSLTPFHIT
jgi:chromodomain-helicase-DNA-binding protein 1